MSVKPRVRISTDAKRIPDRGRAVVRFPSARVTHTMGTKQNGGNTNRHTDGATTTTRPSRDAAESGRRPRKQRTRDSMTPHETQIRVRYEDADPMGFLHHAKYFSYFEVGRLDLFRSMGGDYRKMEETGLYAVVARAECRYRRPARFDDLITIQTTVTSISPAKIEHQYDMRRDSESLATANVTLALVDREGVVQRIPDWFRDAHQFGDG